MLQAAVGNSRPHLTSDAVRWLWQKRVAKVAAECLEALRMHTSPALRLTTFIMLVPPLVGATVERKTTSMWNIEQPM